MSWLEGARARLRLAFARRAAESRATEEFRFHIEMETERLVRDARLSRDEAHRQALIAFGGVEKHKEELRDGRMPGWLSELRAFGRSGRFAWRSIRRRPAFFAIAVSSLAVALGLATTVIAQIDSLMHPYTPIHDVDQVFMLSESGYGHGRVAPPAPEVAAALRESGIFLGVVPSSAHYGRLELGAGPSPANVSVVGPGYFELLGITATHGRLFAPGENAESGVAVVSDDFWLRFGGSEAGEPNPQFTLDGRVYRVVGVVDRRLVTAGGLVGGYELRGDDMRARLAGYQSRGVPPTVWLPTTDPGTAGGQIFVVRLKPRVSEADASTMLASIVGRWHAQYGQGVPPIRVRMLPIRPNPLHLSDFHAVMLGAVVFILIIASANVSALMLARGVVRRRHQAAQLALGARHSDLLRDVAAEVSIVSAAGAVLGVGIAYMAMAVMKAVTPVEMSWLGFAKPNLSPRVFVGLFVIVLVCIALATLIPAWYLASIAPAEALKESAGTMTLRTGSRFKLLVVGELALSMMLLLGASLMSRTASNVATFDFGYEARHVSRISSGVTVVTALSAPSANLGPELLARDLDAVVGQLRSVQGVRDAAWFAHDAPDRGIVVSQATVALDSMLSQPALFNVGPGFLRTMGIPIVDGRDFVEGDRTSAGAVILDERSAARLFPDGAAVGRMVKLGYAQSKEPWVRVVGIARNALHDLPEYPEMEAKPVVYVSRLHPKGFAVEFVYRAERNTGDVAPKAIHAVRDALPPSASCQGAPWLPGYDALLAGRRFTAGIFVALSFASLALAIAGLFSVLSYAVNQRMREFSLRVALGAERRRIVSIVLRDGLVMVLGGTAIGAFVGSYAAFSVYRWLWGVYPVDAVSLVTAEGMLLAVAAVASVLPALRATMANPADVMRAL